MRIRKTLVLAAALAAAMPLLAGCTGEGGEALPTDRGACDFVLDITGHPGVEWVSKTFNDGLSAVKSDCADRVIMANIITDASKASTCPEAQVDTNPGDIEEGSKKERIRSENWEAFSSELTALVNCGVYGAGQDPASAQPLTFKGSDVFSALQTSAELLVAVDGPKSLFVISDMANNMPPLRTPVEGEVGAAVAKLQDDNVIPDLAGVDVVVVGPGTSDRFSPTKQAALVEFWDAYFAAAGASSVKFQQSLG